jgi:hypothetical protein
MVENGLFPIPLQDLIVHKYFVVTMLGLSTFKLSNVVIYWNVVITSQMGLLTDLHFLLRLVIMIPLMEAIGSLLKFAQRQDVSICNFIAIVKVYQGQFYRLYFNNITFINDELWSLNGLMIFDHQQIHLKWVTNYNSNVVEQIFLC